MSSHHVGERIAGLRKARRLSQATLADAAHISLSSLRKFEQGQRNPTDQMVFALADALDVEPERLTGSRRATDSRVHAAMPRIRAAIDCHDAPEDGPVRRLPDLQDAVATAAKRRLSAQYSALAESIPELVVELSRATLTSAPDDRTELAHLLISAFRSADAVAYKFGYHDLSGRIIELMRWTSECVGDPVLASTVAYVRTETFFANKNLAPGLRALERAISAAPPDGVEGGSAALGALHMRAAVVAARLQHDPDLALEHMAEARRLAEGLREGVYGGTAFGPASVRIHEVALAVELGDGARAVHAAADWAPPATLPSERRSHFFIDLARAQLWLGQRDESLASLQAARKIAPQHVREHPHVKETLATLLRLHLAPAEQLLGFVEWSRAL
ncbi:hypothetical protein GCM10027589_34030 [Actinocorallia lasiicapitis]